MKQSVTRTNGAKVVEGKGIDDVTLIWIDPRRGCHKRGERNERDMTHTVIKRNTASETPPAVRSTSLSPKLSKLIH